MKQSTQNDFVYEELGRIDYQSRRYLSTGLKIVTSEENKYIKHIYNMMLKGTEDQRRKQNWALSVKHLLCRLGFMDVRDLQGVGNNAALFKHFQNQN